MRDVDVPSKPPSGGLAPYRFSELRLKPPRQPATPMSTAITCTRAAVPRATLQASKCRRFASTEAVAVEAAKPPIVSTQRPKKISEPLNVKMHRMLYPEYYERVDKKHWIPRPDVKLTHMRRPGKKPIAVKWMPTMRNTSVDKVLSMSSNRRILQSLKISLNLRAKS